MESVAMGIIFGVPAFAAVALWMRRARGVPCAVSPDCKTEGYKRHPHMGPTHFDNDDNLFITKAEFDGIPRDVQPLVLHLVEKGTIYIKE